MSHRYSMLIQWSDRDRLFLVTVPEFVGRVMQPCASGETHEKAVQQGKEVIETYLDLWQEDGEPLPEPSVFQQVQVA